MRAIRWSAALVVGGALAVILLWRLAPRDGAIAPPTPARPTAPPAGAARARPSPVRALLPTASAPPAIARAIDRLVAKAFRPDAPGGAVIVTQGGRVLYAAGRGVADRRTRAPIDVDTAFHIGSVGKQFTALAILLLVDDGRLGLDDPIGRHLPELAALGDGVTLRRLLGHTAGIPDVYDALYAATDAADAAAPGAPRNADLVQAVADAVRRPDDLDFAPGTDWAYSNTGFDLLGAVIERVAGEPYGAFLGRRVFGPLGMADTFAWDPARLAAAHRARGYTEDGREWTLVDHDPMDAINGSGSIYATAADLYRYEQGVRGGRLLSAASRAAWTEPGRLADGAATGYGLGLEIWRDDDDEPVVSHDGLWLGYAAYMARFPRRDVMVAVLTNDAEADPETLGLAIAAKVLAGR